MIKIRTSQHAAWRAFYVYIGTAQVFHLGVDPTADSHPNLFGAIRVSKYRSLSFRIRLPHIPWRFVMRCNYHPIATGLYQASQRFWLSLDGRKYGRK